MARYLEDFISKYEIESPLNKTIYQITSHIKNSHDYNTAIQIILNNNLKLEDIVTRTCRLKFSDIVELADRLIRLKNSSIE